MSYTNGDYIIGKHVNGVSKIKNDRLRKFLFGLVNSFEEDYVLYSASFEDPNEFISYTIKKHEELLHKFITNDRVMVCSWDFIRYGYYFADNSYITCIEYSNKIVNTSFQFISDNGVDIMDYYNELLLRKDGKWEHVNDGNIDEYISNILWNILSGFYTSIHMLSKSCSKKLYNELVLSSYVVKKKKLIKGYFSQLK